MANQCPADGPDLEVDVDFWLCNPLADSSSCLCSLPGSQSSRMEDCELESWLSVDSSALPPSDRFPASELQSDVVEKKSGKAKGEIWKTTLSCPKATSSARETLCTADMDCKEPEIPAQVSGQSHRLVRKLTDLEEQHASPAVPSSEASFQALDCKKEEKKRKNKGKAGKKQNPCECFLCAEVLPNRLKLIVHLKKAHGIERSQSLMYKRLNQGEDEIKRLYMKYRKNYRLVKS